MIVDIEIDFEIKIIYILMSIKMNIFLFLNSKKMRRFFKSNTHLDILNIFKNNILNSDLKEYLAELINF